MLKEKLVDKMINKICFKNNRQKSPEKFSGLNYFYFKIRRIF